MRAGRWGRGCLRSAFSLPGVLFSFLVFSLASMVAVGAFDCDAAKGFCLWKDYGERCCYLMFRVVL